MILGNNLEVDEELHKEIIESCKSLFLTKQFANMRLENRQISEEKSSSPNNNINFMNKLNKSYNILKKKYKKKSIYSKVYLDSLPNKQSVSFTKSSTILPESQNESNMPISPLKLIISDEQKSLKSQYGSKEKEIEPKDPDKEENQQKIEVSLKGEEI
jgi:hypothetical protein